MTGIECGVRTANIRSGRVPCVFRGRQTNRHRVGTDCRLRPVSDRTSGSPAGENDPEARNVFSEARASDQERYASSLVTGAGSPRSFCK